MDLILKILGGFTLSVIVLVVVVILYLWWKLRRLVKNLEGASFPTPSTVELKPDPSPEWLESDDAKRGLAELAASGYVRGDAFTVDGMLGVGLVALHHPATGAFGCYYDHHAVGHWADLCLNFADGLELTISDAPNGQQMDTRPGTEKIFMHGSSVATRHALIVERAAGQAIKQVAPQDFRAEFMAAYARDMAWRNSKGGVSPEEFNRVAAGHKDLTTGQLTEAYKESKLNELSRWSGEALEKFAEATTLSVAEWKKYENNLIIFHESFHAPAYLDYLNSFLNLDEDAANNYATATAAGLSAHGLLERITRDTGDEFIPLGAVEQPRALTIYGIKYAPEDASA